MSAKRIIHESNSKTKASESAVEKASKFLSVKENAALEANNHVLESEGDMEIAGNVKSTGHTQLKSTDEMTVTETAHVHSGKTTQQKSGGSFYNDGRMTAQNHSFDAEGWWFRNLGTIDSEESTFIDSYFFLNVFGGNMTAGKSMIING